MHNKGKNVSAIKMVNITKNFGGVNALNKVNFEVEEGEIRGLVGENGAGKSTLMKILSGVHTDYEGDLYLWGKKVKFKGTSDALTHGIGMVYQELSIINSLTVAENNFLGKQLTNRFGVIKWKEMRKLSKEHLKNLGINVDVDMPLNILPFSIRQLVEIAKVVFSGARIIIMDEPTSSLSHLEIDQLFRLMRTLKEKGHTIIFISHFIEDVMAISDTITILKDGELVDTLKNEGLDKQDVINKMVGFTKSSLVREADEIVELKTPKSEILLKVEGLTRSGDFENVSFGLRKGEILGLWGLLGSGADDVGKAIFGLINYEKGKVILDGKVLPKNRPYRVKDLGIAYIAEDRRESLFHKFEIYKNITLPYLAKILGPRLNWIIKYKKENKVANEQINNFSIKTSGTTAPLNSLSGGNQQKVALAKWLTVTPKVVILQEPTRGVDVGAKAEIVQSIKNLKNGGLSCIVISMEPETILDLCDRVLIFERGKIINEIKDTKISKIRMLELV